MNTLGKLPEGVLQALFCDARSGDNGCIVWLYQGFRP